MGADIRTALEAVANSSIPKIVLGLFAVCLAGTAAIAIIQNAHSWAGKTPPAGIAAIDTGRLGMVIGTAGTASAFLATLFVAERNYRRGRENIPHLTMRLHVARIAVSGQYDAIIIALEAENTGSALCRVDEIQWAVHALSNYDDETA